MIRGTSLLNDRIRLITPIALAIQIAGIAGCTHIVTQTTAYYEEGPNQLDPPEGDLDAGTKAWVLGSQGSYVRVWTETGVNAWVWDRAVMTLWDYNQKMDEDKKRRDAREKWLKSQGATAPPQPADPNAQPRRQAEPQPVQESNPSDEESKTAE